MKNHYETLGVSRDATPKEIHEAYRLIAKRTHPQNTGNDKKLLVIFIGASKAYKAIRLPEDRKKYDLELKLAENPPVQNPVVTQASESTAQPVSLIDQLWDEVFTWNSLFLFIASILVTSFLFNQVAKYHREVDILGEMLVRKELGCTEVDPRKINPGEVYANAGCRETPVYKKKYPK